MQREKARQVWQEHRSWGRRLWMMLGTVLGCAFLWVIFTPLELIMGNQADLSFGVSDVLGPMLLLAAGVVAVGLLLALLLRGTLYDVFLSLLFGFLFMSYLQGTFLHLRVLGRLAGDAIQWGAYAGHAVWNLLLWGAVMLLPLALRYYAPALWQKVVLIVPWMLIGVQATALTVALWGYEDPKFPEHGAVVTQAGMYELSSDDNILVFLLDRLDTRYVETLIIEQPAVFSHLDGFTYYPNHTALYGQTYPAMTYLLTGDYTLFERSREEYLEQAWAGSDFLPALRAEGYQTKVYTTPALTFGLADRGLDQVDNIQAGDRHVARWPLLGQLMQLSAYRNAPHALKASFWSDTDAFLTHITYTGSEPQYRMDDLAFYAQLKEQGLTVQEEDYNFAFYHFTGAHGPYMMDPESNPTDASDMITHLWGQFHMVQTFLDEMKELGLYEQATIIIMGDHGRPMVMENLDEAVTTALFYKPSGAMDTPMETSYLALSHDNFQATVIDAAWLESGRYGTPYHSETGEEPRRYYHLIEEPAVYFKEYSIEGDARDFRSWSFVDDWLP